MRMIKDMFETRAIATLTITILLTATEVAAFGPASDARSAEPLAASFGVNSYAVTFLTVDPDVQHFDDADELRSDAAALAESACATPVSGRSTPVAGDCLFILRAAVHVSSCALECACAPKGTLPVSASDALLCLKSATGQSVTLNCPCLSPTSTSTSSTSTTSSTTTTLSLSDIGQAVYDSTCAVCHRAGSHDTDGFAPNLAGKGNDVKQNLGSIDPQMAAIFLSQDDVAALRAFLNSR